MKKSLIALALVSAFAAPTFAEESAPPPEHSLTGNVGLFSSYRFRGIDQTFSKPALQGGIDYAHSSGLYVGNWNSNVNSGAGYPEGNLEMDLYGGYKMAFGDFGIDVGGIYYYYPGSTYLNKTVKNGEVYVGASWKFISVKYYYGLTDYFGAKTATGGDTKGVSYIDLSANYDLGNGWGVNGHVGYLDFDKVNNGSYTDWKLGVTKDLSGWIVGLACIGTDAKGNCSSGEFYCFSNDLSTAGNQTGSKTRDAGRGTAVLSVSKSF
ncbi:TorF family putative porin [Ferribacterium limneticum]|uniref:TorF family putative porin n=1 Tax=Ferribacterium limneticum TaxID=76259 RepID=UPI001CFAF6AD|nr:TorF family putative porin [Ferribacterium limneticum]UCV28023.1 TorF family putative porin [Ferribacterium limneticum]UCV31940.1 TorF family putative porin [Ferribacterium limneticum]